jgi:hypothetical protein
MPGHCSAGHQTNRVREQKTKTNTNGIQNLTME